MENPHVQRIKYCELLVTEFAQRCRGDRYPSIERDMKASNDWQFCPHLLLMFMYLNHSIAARHHIH